jgi:hypothetical protein
MRPIYQLNRDFTDALDEYKDWVFSPAVQQALSTKIDWQAARLKEDGKPEFSTAAENLQAIDHDAHIGYPTDQYGINLNYNFLQSERRTVDPAFLAEIRRANNVLDEKLQLALGARFCALKMYYPADGYINWHTNWNVPGYNIIFTYSPSGNGYWRHIDPAGSTSPKPNLNKLVHIDDVPGWHCKVGYFGKKEEADRVVWHSAYTREPRLTVSYVVFEKAIWENMVEELAEG